MTNNAKVDLSAMYEPLKDTHKQLNIRIFDGEVQPAFVRKTLTVGELTEAILREFKREQELDANNRYALILREVRVDHDAVVDKIRLNDGDVLLFEYEQVAIAPSETTTLAVAVPPQQLWLQSNTGERFPVNTFPALVGRPNVSETQIPGITIDLSHLPEARTVSRPHARITRQGNIFFIESIKQSKMVILNSRSLPLGEKEALKNGDTVQLGAVILMVKIE